MFLGEKRIEQSATVLWSLKILQMVGQKNYYIRGPGHNECCLQRTDPLPPPL